MGTYVLLEEFHLSFRIPKDLDDAACDAIRRILEGRYFQTAFHPAVRQVVRQFPDLEPIRVRISH